MDCLWALIYPLRGRRWFIWLPALACVTWIPLFGQIVGFIYGLEVIRQVAHNNPIPPGFERSVRTRMVQESPKAKRSDSIQELDGQLKRAVWVIISLIGHVFLLSGVFSVLDAALRSPNPYDNNLLSLAEGLFGVFMMLHWFVGSIRYLISDDKRALWQVRINAHILLWRWPLIGWALLNIVFYFGLLYGPCLLPITIVAFNLNQPAWYIAPADRTPMYYILIEVSFALFFLWFAMVPCGVGYILGQMALRLDPSDVVEKRKNEKAKAL